jgi:hypothetical protein
MGSVRLGYHVEVVSPDLVAGSRAYRYGVAGDRGQGLRQEALLDSAGGIEILGEAGVVQMALVVDGVLDGNRGLQDKAFKEVSFIETEGASAWCGDDEL